MRGFARCAAAMVAAAALAACSGGDDADVQPIDPTGEPTAEASPEPTEPEDPYAIPDEIDVEYVQSVVDAILPIYIQPELEAYRSAPHDFPPDELMAAVRASFSPQLSVEQLTNYAGELADEGRASERLAVIENRPDGGWTVRDLERADAECIIVAFDYPEGGSEEGGRAVLLTGYSERDVEDLNPTPWVVDRNGPRSMFADGELEERCTVDQLAELDADEEAEA